MMNSNKKKLFLNVNKKKKCRAYIMPPPTLDLNIIWMIRVLSSA